MKWQTPLSVLHYQEGDYLLQDLCVALLGLNVDRITAYFVQHVDVSVCCRCLCGNGSLHCPSVRQHSGTDSPYASCAQRVLLKWISTSRTTSGGVFPVSAVMICSKSSIHLMAAIWSGLRPSLSSILLLHLPFIVVKWSSVLPFNLLMAVFLSTIRRKYLMRSSDPASQEYFFRN